MQNLSIHSFVGLILIGLAGILLVIFTFLYKKGKGYSARHDPAIDRLKAAQIASIEIGLHQHIGLGQAIWSSLYPGLGIHGLSVLPVILNDESIAVGASEVTAGDSTLVILAQQVLNKGYSDGFSLALERPVVNPTLLGPTAFSYASGLTVDLGYKQHHSLILLGNYGLEALLFFEEITRQKGYIFSASGNLSSQAALYPSVNDVMIGENIFLLPGVLRSSSKYQASWITEDLLKIILIILLLVGSVMKIVGIL